MGINKVSSYKDNSQVRQWHRFGVFLVPVQYTIIVYKRKDSPTLISVNLGHVLTYNVQHFGAKTGIFRIEILSQKHNHAPAFYRAR